MTMIVYFTGTGNSLDAAKNISIHIVNSELLPITRFLPYSTIQIKTDKLILVYPTYLFTIPYPVRQFIQKLDLSNINYLAAITTSENGNNLSAITINRLLKTKKRKLNYFYEIKMPQSTPTGIRPTKGDDHWVESVSPANTASIFENHKLIYKNIAADLANSTVQPIQAIPIGKRLLESFINMISKNNSSKLSFYSDATCNGCKICEKICPVDRVKVSENKVSWNQNHKCYYCFACFNACPNQSILLKNYTKKDGRYINPNITLADLINQKTHENHAGSPSQSVSVAGQGKF